MIITKIDIRFHQKKLEFETFSIICFYKSLAEIIKENHHFFRELKRKPQSGLGENLKYYFG